MLGPKDVMMQLEDEACADFYEKHGRGPNPKELERIQQQAFDGIGEHYAEMGDYARDMAEDR